MSENLLIGILKDSINAAVMISAPFLLTGIVVGLAISIFQATTQIQEQTLTFVPKLVAMALVALFAGSWMLHQLVDFTKNIFNMISKIS
ncbi:flagellar biosynthesis protein FliQ [Clostridium oryzae]|uniref:Flagellar biosynthetic protein FliQ n=1 Tax=Clostridium oryzae TaxID=1450648 RepID=A0A1V4ITK9_9CLOT|nr:flagellar biosynthesis protein FliQ [Clostridium oryzae]OPJ63266.1 flagellar biosynthetic protein FliQ [Clostridium oryzae]